MRPISVYIHIPFCIHRCAYCDFNAYAGKTHLINEYVDALQLEIKNLRVSAEEILKVHTSVFPFHLKLKLASKQIQVRYHFYT